MTPQPGELEYGSILPNGEDWRLRKYDAGMGETEYRIFRNGTFFAQFDNRKDAEIVMTAMTIPYNPQAERDKIPSTDLEKVFNTLKGVSSRYLRQEFPEIKNMLWGDSFWSDSKFIASTGQVSLDVLMKYVESQNEPKVKK